MGKDTKDLTQFERKRTALVEVSVHKEEIAELLAQKMSITAIHRALVDKYELKTSYSGFVKVLGRIKLWESSPQKKKQATVKVKAVSQPQSIAPPKIDSNKQQVEMGVSQKRHMHNKEADDSLMLDNSAKE